MNTRICISCAALFLVFGLLPGRTDAQLGINFWYQQPLNEGWVLQSSTDQTGQQVLLKSGYRIGIDYRFFLEGVRIEFMPEVSFQSSFYESVPEADFSTYALGLVLHTNFYLLDLQGDCGCPTFSKQGSFLSKGLFVFLSPGVLFQQQRIDSPDLELGTNTLAFTSGAGIGLDIGLSYRFTLTPRVGILWIPSLAWDGLNEMEPKGIPWQAVDASPDQWHWQGGLRLEYRFP
jgi:hypothetical protein